MGTPGEPIVMRAADENAANLIARLFSYAPRAGRVSLEDYCTEALAWCLIVSPCTAKHWLQLVAGRMAAPPGSLLNLRTGISVSTQERYGPTADGDDAAARFDLVVRPNGSAKFIIVVESKV